MARSDSSNSESRIATRGGGACRLSVVYREVAGLALDPVNPRLHTRRQIQQIARSIEVFGFNVPVLINAERQVIAGHGRVLAARFLGMAQVPTIMLGCAIISTQLPMLRKL